MRIAVRYHTRSGNTEKLAAAIAEAAGVSTETVAQDLQEEVDMLFLGCSYYAFDVDAEVKAFIQRNSGKIGCVVCDRPDDSGGCLRAVPFLCAI